MLLPSTPIALDVTICSRCGAVKIIPKALTALAGQALVCIEDLLLIKKLLDHQDANSGPYPQSINGQNRERHRKRGYLIKKHGDCDEGCGSRMERVGYLADGESLRVRDSMMVCH